jgi:hypothetical protein
VHSVNVFDPLLITFNSNGASANKYRTPAELFGRGPEMDLALEKKLLSNLKKYHTYIN